jgi:hypothetical protein
LGLLRGLGAMTVKIIDGNNWIRVKMEESLGGASIANLWYETVTDTTSRQIFVFDGYNSRAKRRAIYPEYKAKRKPADQSFFDGLNFFKELLIDAPRTVNMIEIPEYEADDVIANLAVFYSEMSQIPGTRPTDINGDVVIISTDKDLTQLRVLPNVTTLAEPKVDPKWVLLYKMFVGDSSDNIKGVAGFGDVSWEKTSRYWKDYMSVLFWNLWEADNNSDGDSDWTEQVVAACADEGMSDKMLDKIWNTDFKMLYRLISFYKIPQREITKNMRRGSGDTNLATDKLNQFDL